MSRIAGSIFMLPTAVISLMYCSMSCSIQTRKRGLIADRENNMWRYLDGVSAPPAKKKKSEVGEKQYEKEERRRAFLPSWQLTVSRADSCEEDLELIDRAQDTVDNNTNAAGDMDTGSALDDYDNGVDDASDADSDIEERRVDSLINKYL